MDVVLSTVGRFHIFPLAKELQKSGHLKRIYTGFPWLRVKDEGISRDKVTTFPYIRPFLMALRHLPFSVPEGVSDGIHQLSLVSLDAYVARTLPDCDVFVGHEGAGLLSGAEAKRRGSLYVCDRGCSHMAWREDLLIAENERLELPARRQPNTFQREIEEYDLADLVMVPSGFVRDSFIASGLPADKIAVVPYGVDLRRFRPLASPSADRFDIIFVGQITARKGIKDLFDAFQMANIANKHLTLVGEIDPQLLDRYAALFAADNVHCLGHVGHDRLSELYSRSHAFCLPSIEDGWAMVVTEAMACGCPPIVSTNTGARDIIRHGENGYIVPIRAPEAIASHLEDLARDRDMRDQLSAAALASVEALNGWESYGQNAIAAYRTAIGNRTRA